MPPTQKINGRLQIGFEVRGGDPNTGPYLSTWAMADKKALKQATLEDVKGTPTYYPTIPDVFLNKWAFVKLVTDVDGYLEEVDVQNTITAALAELNLAAKTEAPYRLFLRSPVNALGVSYLYYNNTRVCYHSYELDYQLKEDPTDPPNPIENWTLYHKPAGKAPVIVDFHAQLSWELNVT